MKEDGTNVIERFRDVHPAYVDPARNPLQNWQTFGYTFITLDPQIDTKIREFESTNELEFVLGERSFDDWDEYVEEWKRAGGQELLEQVAEQLGAALP